MVILAVEVFLRTSMSSLASGGKPDIATVALLFKSGIM